MTDRDELRMVAHYHKDHMTVSAGGSTSPTRDLARLVLAKLDRFHHITVVVDDQPTRYALADIIKDISRSDGVIRMSQKNSQRYSYLGLSFKWCNARINIIEPNGFQSLAGLDTSRALFVDAQRASLNLQPNTKGPDMHAQEQNTMDTAVSKLISDITGKGRGFVLELMSTLDDASVEGFGQAQELARTYLDCKASLEAMSADGDIQEGSEAAETATQLEADMDEAMNQLCAFLADMPKASHSREIAVRESLPPVDASIPPADLRAHIVYDIGSLADMALTMGTERGACVFIGDKDVTVVLNEYREAGEAETARLKLVESKPFQWLAGKAGTKISQRDLSRQLIENQAYLVDHSWLDKLRSISATTKISLDSGIQRGENVQSVSVETKGGSGVLQLPERFVFRCPILEIDDMGEPTELWADVDVILEIIMPRSAEEGIGFELIPLNLHAHRVKRKSALEDQINSSLDSLREHHAGGRWDAESKHPVQIVRGDPVRYKPTLGWDAFNEREEHAV